MTAGDGYVNLPSVNTVPVVEQATPADTPLVFSSGTGNAISIWDPEAGVAVDAEVRLALIATNGTLDLSQTTGLTFIDGASGDEHIAFTGTIANINAALEGLTFTPTPGYKGWANLGVGSNDLGITGIRTSGLSSDDHGVGDLDKIDISVGDPDDPAYVHKGVNQPPVNTVPSPRQFH